MLKLMLMGGRDRTDETSQRVPVSGGIQERSYLETVMSYSILGRM